MSRRALIFVQSRDPEGETYIGAKMVDPAPRMGNHVTFMHEGSMQKVRVAEIRPSGWNIDFGDGSHSPRDAGLVGIKVGSR